MFLTRVDIFQSLLWVRKTKIFFFWINKMLGWWLHVAGWHMSNTSQNRSTIQTHKVLSTLSNREVRVAQWNQLSISYKSCGSKGCWVFIISDHSLFALAVFASQGWLLLEDFWIRWRDSLLMATVVVNIQGCSLEQYWVANLLIQKSFGLRSVNRP
jgi:hypothetical protein